MRLEEKQEIEKRAGIRVKLRSPIQFESKDLRGFGGSLAYDISEGGVRMNFNEFVPPGKELILKCQLKAEETAECLAKVVWIQKLPFSERYQAGLQFESTGNSFEQRNKIRKYIQLEF